MGVIDTHLHVGYVSLDGLSFTAITGLWVRKSLAKHERRMGDEKFKEIFILKIK
jgi:hypothetical protein